jgi:DNA-binding NarL/FixJ family response regulator
MAASASGKTSVLTASACSFVVIEDDPLLLDLLSDALRQRFKPAALHAFSAAKPGLDHCLREHVDIVLTDLRLPDLDGREVVRQLRQRDRKPRVIVLTGQVDATLPAELVALGVAGFVDKATPLEHAIRAVERVLAGGMYFFAGVMPAASGMTARKPATAGVSAAVLSPRERDVAHLVAGGLSSKEIAQKLELSTRTVENYRANLMQKVGVRDTASLVRWSLENGLG